MNDEKLIEAGIDMDGLLGRLMGNTSLVQLFIRKFMEDKNYEKLTLAFAQEDMKAAEMASHTLKGMCGNLSLTQLFSLFTQQVNLIRGGDYAAAKAMMEPISICYRRAMDGMAAFLAEN